ncbi:hypothetical protein R3P38DRAFT_2473958, partial [Favolaschia claudopus]
IFTSSKYSIRAICYAAGKNHTTGWDCANGDLLKAIAEKIRMRSRRVSFCYIRDPQQNRASEAARKLARD